MLRPAIPSYPPLSHNFVMEIVPTSSALVIGIPPSKHRAKNLAIQGIFGASVIPSSRKPNSISER